MAQAKFGFGVLLKIPAEGLNLSLGHAWMGQESNPLEGLWEGLCCLGSCQQSISDLNLGTQ